MIDTIWYKWLDLMFLLCMAIKTVEMGIATLIRTKLIWTNLVFDTYMYGTMIHAWTVTGLH